jgi:hypothetical protein
MFFLIAWIEHLFSRLVGELRPAEVRRDRQADLIRLGVVRMVEWPSPRSEAKSSAIGWMRGHPVALRARAHAWPPRSGRFRLPSTPGPRGLGADG